MPNPVLAKTVIVCVVPKLIEHAPNIIKTLWCHFFGGKTQPEKKEKEFYDPTPISPGTFKTSKQTTLVPRAEPKKPKKPRDTRPFTKVHFDYANKIHRKWQEYNNSHPGKYRKQDVIIAHLNKQMGLDKSRTAMSKLWNGTIKREDLPAGEDYFDTEEYKHRS